MTAEQSMRAVLDEYPLAGVQRSELLGSAGGLSGARFWRISAAEGTLCLRQWPAESPTAERLARIHRVLEHAAAHGFTRFPLPRRTHAGRTFVELDGRLWQLEPWLAGAAVAADQATPEQVAAAMRTLAEFHGATVAAPWEPAPERRSRSPGLLLREERLASLVREGCAELCEAAHVFCSVEAQRAAMLEILGLVEQLARRALAEVSPFATQVLPLQPCIRDIWSDNVLFAGEHVTGLIDFGAMDVDHEATDVARLAGSLAADRVELWTAALEAYESVRPLSGAERRLIAVFDGANVVLSPLNWVRWLVIERRTFEHPAAVLSRLEHFRRRLRSRAGKAGIWLSEGG